MEVRSYNREPRNASQGNSLAEQKDLLVVCSLRVSCAARYVSMSVSVVIAVLVLLTPYSQLPFVMSTRGPLWFCHQVRFFSSYTPA
jgi:hypothetical protein